MHPIKADWIQALRSDTYRQGQGQLRDCQDRFCCLGVAANVIDPERWVAKYEDDELNGDPQEYSFGRLESSLDHDDLAKLGITALEQRILISLNDSAEFSFRQIADVLERNLFVYRYDVEGRFWLDRSVELTVQEALLPKGGAHGTTPN